MNVNSVSFTGAPKAAKKPLTKGQKAAAITGAVAGTAAVASAVAAFAMGKGVGGNILAGYKAMGSFVAKNATKAGNFVAEKAQDAWIGIQKAFTGFISKFGTTAEEAATLAEDLATMNK